MRLILTYTYHRSIRGFQINQISEINLHSYLLIFQNILYFHFFFH